MYSSRLLRNSGKVDGSLWRLPCAGSRLGDAWPAFGLCRCRAAWRFCCLAAVLHASAVGWPGPASVRVAGGCCPPSRIAQSGIWLLRSLNCVMLFAFQSTSD